MALNISSEVLLIGSFISSPFRKSPSFTAVMPTCKFNPKVGYKVMKEEDKLKRKETKKELSSLNQEALSFTAG